MSPWGDLVLFVRKKDGSIRMCSDYGKLHNVSMKNKYPLPRNDDLVDQHHSASLYCMFCLRKSYHYMKIRASNIPKTPFGTRSGHYLNLRKRIWLELLKYYEITILYHPRKANVAVDALSKKTSSMGILVAISVEERPLARDVHMLANIIIQLQDEQTYRALTEIDLKQLSLNEGEITEVWQPPSSPMSHHSADEP
ncbi:hypothetical protein MTR67_012319 [Solanum verrucosum]|uniref:Uncharacterized protein n=1 Tax=Solanum verrucosum TaxID=315347 RepID=A0AAF0QFH1_SOLVR|nr:hypothetical protein MTR67_012319 [Solanum verrucosum]